MWIRKTHINSNIRNTKHNTESRLIGKTNITLIVGGFLKPTKLLQFVNLKDIQMHQGFGRDQKY